MTISELLFMSAIVAILIGGLGFIDTFLTKGSRKRERDWLNEGSKGRTEEEIMKPAKIRDSFHEFYKKAIVFGFYCLVAGVIAKIVEGLLGY